MPIATAIVINNGKAPAPTPTWGKNIVAITASTTPSLKQSETISQDNIQPLDISSEELAILNKLTATPSGTWFEYKINGCNKRRQIKLSWYSPTIRQYIFVGPNGMQIASLSERTLAHDLYTGSARILEHTSTPFISRVLNTILRKLKQATGVTHTTTTSQHQNPKHYTQTAESTKKCIHT